MLSHSPSIVLNHLYTYLDAANSKSYPGNGTVWKDISGNGQNFNLVGSPAFSSTNSGYFSFVPANSSYSVSASTLSVSTQSITVSAWVKVLQYGNWNNIVNNNWTNNGWLMFADTSNWFFGVCNGGTQYDSQIPHNNTTNWTHVTGTYDGVNVKLYINGTLTNTVSTSGIVMNVGFNVYVGSDGNYGTSTVAMVQLYNTALSSDQIFQNFNAHRGRFSV